MDTPLGAKRKKDTAPEVDDFYRLGKELQNRSGSSIGAFLPEDRRFREFFGIGAYVALVLWNALLEYGVIPESGLIIHMLWALHWMKVYPKQHAGSAAAGGSGGAIDPKTWKKYYWPFVEAIALIEPFVVSLRLRVVHILYIFLFWHTLFNYVHATCLRVLKFYIFSCNPFTTTQIIFESRNEGCKNQNDCKLNVDGVDCPIPNHGPAFASHKFNGKSAFRYELGTDIEKGELAWLHGPFPAGYWPDVKIFRHALMQMLDENERVEADDGYIGEAPGKVKCPMSFANPVENLKMQQIVRNRHETVNGRMKNWEILRVMYRHDLSTHGTVFRAIAVITQLAIRNGEPLFPVDYKDPK